MTFAIIFTIIWLLCVVFSLLLFGHKFHKITLGDVAISFLLGPIAVIGLLLEVGSEIIIWRRTKW